MSPAWRTIDRRSFLQSSFALSVGAGVSGLIPIRAAVNSQRASVVEFGADASGLKDSTAAVRRAIASLSLNNARLVFPAGKYRFDESGGTAMQFTGFNGLEVFANNAELVFSGSIVPFRFHLCKDIGLHDMKLDWERPAFSQGVVTVVDRESFTIQIDPGFPVTGAERFSTIAEFDPHARRPAASGFYANRILVPASLAGAQRLRIPWRFNGSAQTIRVGMLLVLVHAATGAVPSGAFTFEGCERILMDEVEVRHAPSTAFLLRGCRDLQMDGVKVAPEPATKGIAANQQQTARRLLAAGSDGLQCSDCHGKLLLKDVHFEGIAGDAVNVYQSYWSVSERIDDKTVVLKTTGALDTWQLPESGDFVQFSSPATLQLLGEIGISAVQLLPSSGSRAAGVKLTFPETLSPVIVPGTLVCSVVDAPRISLDHSTIANTLGRGLVLHTRAEITNNLFEGCAQEAILLAPDAASRQGPAVQNIRIRSNTFEGCNLAQAAFASARSGIIRVGTSQHDEAEDPGAQKVALNSGVRIQGNSFIRSVTAAIYASSVDDLTITDNALGRAQSAGSMPVAIMLCDVADAQVSNNVSNVPQTVGMTRCAVSVAMEGNKLLTNAAG